MSNEAEQLRAALERAERERDIARRVAAAMARIADRINANSIDLEGNLNAICTVARDLTDSTSAFVYLVELEQLILRGGSLDVTATPEDSVGRTQRLDSHWPVAIAVREGRAVAVDDFPAYLRARAQATDDSAHGYSQLRETVGIRSALSVPLGSAPHAGAIAVVRDHVRPFDATETDILQAFAAQAMTAIETARLLRELRERNTAIGEALEQQKALSDVLNVIASSATDARPVLDAILETGMRICGADGASAFVVNGGQLQIVAARGFLAPLANDARARWPIDDRSSTGQSILERRTIFVGRRQLEKYSNTSFVTSEYGIQCTIAAPLLRDNRALGAIALARKADEEFTPQQVALIETFADQAVIAVENARLFNELQASNAEVTEALRREEASSEILRQISRAPEALDETLGTIVSAGMRLAGLDRAGIFLRDGDEVVLRAAAQPDGSPLFDAPVRSALSGVYAHVLRTRTPHVTEFGKYDLPGTDIAFEHRMDAIGLRTRVLVPILRGDEVLGFLGVGNTTGEPIPEASISLLRSFADQAAIAIENARLIRELRESNRAITENLDVQRVMGNVLSIVAAAPTDLGITLPQIAAAAQQLCDAQTATVHWIDGDQLHAFDGGPFKVTVRPFDPEWARSSMMGASAMEKREIELAAPLEELAARYPYTAAMWRAAPVPVRNVNGLAVPMQGRGESVGAISVWRNNMVGYTERQRTVLRALATQAVVAIENARLFRQLQTKTEELEVASRHKSEFLANMSHELRTPLNAIIGYAELLQEECEDLGQEDFLPDLGKIHSAGKHLLTLISGILDLSKVEAGRMTMFLEDFDIATLIRDADAIVRPLVEKNRNRFVLDVAPDIGTMHADLVKVRQVLFNLLSNSAKFTDGGEIALTVRAHPATATITFAIRDTGIGMTDEQLGRLFEAFSQANAETSRKYGGTGLGLALSREFCRMMGGDISVTSIAGEGSTFTVTLPRTCTDTEQGA